MHMIASKLSRAKRCRGNKIICSRSAKYSARNDERPANVKSLKTRPEEKGLQFLTKRQQWNSGSDWGRQAIPRSWCSHWECTVAERFVGATTNVSETEERRRRRPSTSAVRQRLSPVGNIFLRSAFEGSGRPTSKPLPEPNPTRDPQSVELMEQRGYVIWFFVFFFAEKTSRAAAFRTDWSLDRSCPDEPASRPM